MIGKRTRPDRDDDRDGGTALPALTPLLDVLFMLLFFMVLTANAPPFALDLRLPAAPETGGQVVVDRDRTVIALPTDRSGWAFDGMEMPRWEAVAAAIDGALDRRPETVFVIAGDAQGRLEPLVTVIDFLRSRGVTGSKVLVRSAKD